MHQHSGYQNEPKNCGSDMCIVENREVENYSELDQAAIANHVWESCRPERNFMTKAPTVSARRVQLMRVQLQSDFQDPTFLEEEDKTSSKAVLCRCLSMKTSGTNNHLASSTPESDNEERDSDDDEEEEGEDEEPEQDCESDS